MVSSKRVRQKYLTIILTIFLVFNISINQKISLIENSTAYAGDPGSTIILTPLMTIEATSPSPTDQIFGLGFNVVNNQIYISDFGGDTVGIYNLQGEFQRSFGSPGSELGELNNPGDIETNGTHLFILDTGNDQVQVTDLEGNFVTSFGETGTNPGQITYSLDMALYDDKLYIMDGLTQEVEIYSESGVFLSQHTLSTSGTTNYGIDIMDDLIYITDFQNGEVDIYNMTLHYQSAFGLDSTIGPVGIDVTEDGIYVGNQTSIDMYNRFGNFIGSVTSFGEFLPEFERLDFIREIDSRVYAVNEYTAEVLIFAKDVYGLSAISDNEDVLISWISPSPIDNPNIDYFNIYRGTTSGEYQKIASVDDNSLLYLDSVVNPGQRYYYVVTAVNGFGETSFSNEVSIELSLSNFESDDSSDDNDSDSSFLLTPSIFYISVILIFLVKLKHNLLKRKTINFN